jgi:hypothetical protein
MKRLLLPALAAGIAVAVCLIASADPTDLGPGIPRTNGAPVATPTPMPTPAPTPAAAGPISPSAASVPIPGQNSGQNLEGALPLVPETMPAGHRHGHGKHGEGGANGEPSASPHGTFEVEQNIRLMIRFRQARTEAANDPAVQAQWEAAHRTRNDPARRAALTLYYNALFDRVAQLDPSVAAMAAETKQNCLDRMRYARLGDDGEPGDDPFAGPEPPVEGRNPPINDQVSQ